MANRRVWMGNAAVVGAVVLVLLGLRSITKGAEPREAGEFSVPENTPPKDASRPKANLLRNAYFGELHLHTAYSFDAYVFGTRNTPREAYKFARGGAITDSVGASYQLRVPLDFTAVTDHAEGLGDYALCSDPNSPVYANEDCSGARAGDMKVFSKVFAGLAQEPPKRNAQICGEDSQRCIEASKGPWQQIQKAAQEFYEPGKFTTFVAFEFSPTLIAGGMVHRNVIFRSAHVPDHVFSAYDGSAEDLWKWLETNCTGECRALAIPHNSNYSWGRQFWDKNTDGSPWTRDILERRARTEPLVEIFQIKGGSECALGVGSAEEECSFEQMFPACKPGEVTRCVTENSLVRSALEKGLLVEEKWGVNPMKYGIIAASDNHDAAPGSTDESSWHGHAGNRDARPEQRLKDPRALQLNPGGIAGVWAEENTRESIWDALARKETFGTSGTRVRVRFFGGWEYPHGLDKSPSLVKIGYQKGVPMGGDLPMKPAGKQAPTFVLWATRDPNSAPLQKLQIIKGWAENGKTHEAVYDVACSEGIAPDPQTHKCADNGAKVNLSDCSISQDKGAAELSVTWTDPTFNADDKAFYYVRVIENPVCRWSTHDALKLGMKQPDGVPATIQERAWSSPIWYEPARH